MLILCFMRHSENVIVGYVITIIYNAFQIMNLFFTAGAETMLC